MISFRCATPARAPGAHGHCRLLRDMEHDLSPALRLGLLFDVMTSYDWHMTMTGTRIADLKSRLSEHLRKVRAGGSLTILDRDTPIARIIPCHGVAVEGQTGKDLSMATHNGPLAVAAKASGLRVIGACSVSIASGMAFA